MTHSVRFLRFFATVLVLVPCFSSLVARGQTTSCQIFANASDGADSQPGTLTQPVQSLERAAAIAGPAARICVAAGEYFRGADADGTTLDVGSGTLTLELQAFAGETDILLSMPSLAVVGQGGTLVIAAGSTDRIFFSSGILNTDSPDGMEQLTMEGAEIVVDDVNVTMGPRLKNVTMRQGALRGIAVWEASQYLVTLEGPVSLDASSLPPLSGGRLLVSGPAPVDIAGDINLDDARMDIGSSGTLSLAGVVSITTETSIVANGDGAELRLDDTLLLQGPGGTVNLPVPNLVIYNVDTAQTPTSAWTLSLTTNRGELRGAAADSDGQSTPPPLNSSWPRLNLSGDWTVGSSSSNSTLSTPELNIESGNVLSYESIEIIGSAFGIATGRTLTMDDAAVILNQEDVLVSIEGALLGSGSPEVLRLQKNGVVSLAVGAEISGAEISAPTARIESDGGTIHDLVRVTAGSALEISGVIAGSARLEADQSTITLREDAQWSVSSLEATATVVHLQSNSGLSVSGNIETDALSGFPTRLGTVVLSPTVTSVDAPGPTPFPAVLSTASNVVIRTGGPMESLVVTEGRMELQSSGSADILGPVSISGATLFFHAPTESLDWSFRGGMDATGATVLFDGSMPYGVRLQGMLRLQNSFIQWPQQGLSVLPNTILRLTGPDSIVLPAMSMDAPRGVLQIDTPTTILSGLDLTDGRLIIAGNTRLTVQGGVRRTNGRFEPVEGGILRLEAPTGSPASVRGFSTSVLPSLEIGAGQTRLEESVVVLGSLTVVGGTLDVGAAVGLSVSDSVRVSTGVLSLGLGSELLVAGPLHMTGGEIVAGGSSMNLSDNVRIELQGRLSGTLDMLTLGQSGGATLFSDIPLRARSVQIFDGSTVSLSSRLNVESLLAIGSDASLVLADTVRHLGLGDAPEFINHGTTGGDGTIELSGPDADSPGTVLVGNGTFANIRVDVPPGGGDILAAPSTEPLRLSGKIDFVRGGLDPGGRALSIAGTPTPVITRVMSPSSDGDTTPVGRGFVSSLPISMAAGSRFDVIYTGDVTSLTGPGPEFVSGLVQSLTVDVGDGVNSPPVFGMQFDESIDLPGVFEVTSSSLLRLESADIDLQAPNLSHDISGQISGPGRIFVSAPGIVLVGRTDAPSSIDNLIISVPTGSAEVRLRDMKRVGFLESSLDQLGFVGTRSIRVTSWTHQRGRVRVATALESWRAELVSGDVRLETNSDVAVSSGGRLDLGPDVSWEVTSQRADDAFLTLAHHSEINAQTPVARVRLRSQPGITSGPRLQGPLEITELLDQGSLDISTNGFILTLRDAIWTVGTGLHTFADVGAVFDPVRTGVRLQGTIRLKLARPLRLVNLNLEADVDSLHITSVPVGSDPFPLLVGGSASFAGGLLDMGNSDIVVSNDAPGTLTLGMNEIRAGGLDASTVASEALLLDESYGEFVLAGQSTVTTSGDQVTIPSLRLERNALMDLPPSVNMTISRRLVFGQESATLTTSAPGVLRLADGAVLIRRGRGTLTHAPVPEGDLHVAYDLDDGSVTGHDTRFRSPSLTTGLELPGEVSSLTILAGNNSQGINTILQTFPVRVTDRLSMLSGSWITGESTVTLATDVTYSEGIGDGDAPAVWVRSKPPQREGTLHIDLHLQQTSTLSADRLFGGTSIGNFQLRHLTPDMTTTLATSLDVSTFSVTGEASGTRLRLGGSSVTAQESVMLNGVSVASAPVARFSSRGSMSIDGGAVSDNVLLSADGDMLLDADISNLGVEAGANLTTRGSTFVPQRLVLRADTGTWSTAGSLQVPSLIRSGPGHSPVHIRSALTNQLLTVNHLELTSGSVVLDGIRLRLEGTGTGFVRQDGHVTGTIERSATAGSTAPLVFPLGMDSTYAPLTLTPESGLLTTTIIAVSIGELPVHDRNGLPITTGAGVTVREASRRVWRVSSTVNFASSQPFDISALLPPSAEAVNDTEAARSFIQRRADEDGPWMAVNGTVESVPTDDGLLLRHVATTGILTPVGTTISVGLGEQIGLETGASQLANLSDETVEVLTGTSTIRLLPGQATRMLRAGIPSGDSAPPWRVIRPIPGSSTPDTTSVPVAAWLPSQTSVAFVLPSNPVPAGTTSILASIWESTTANESDIRIVNAWAEGPTAQFSTVSGTMPVFIGTAGPGESARGPAFTQPGSFFLAVRWLDTAVAQQGFSLTATAVPFRAVVAVRDSTAYAILEDGSVLMLATATSVEESPGDRGAPELPTALRIHPVYPNPVRGAATIPVDVPAAATVRLTLVDMLGREVRRVDAGSLSPGRGQLIRVDATGLAAGTYLYVVEAAAAGQTWRETGTMTVLR